jgi:pyruvate,orthophosphate dikinase
MTRIGLPVPPGFTITTEVCTYYYANKRSYPPQLQSQVEAGVANMERIMGTKFGDTTKMPLLVAGALRRARFDAWHDGYDSQSRSQ